MVHSILLRYSIKDPAREREGGLKQTETDIDCANFKNLINIVRAGERESFQN